MYEENLSCILGIFEEFSFLAKRGFLPDTPLPRAVWHNFCQGPQAVQGLPAPAAQRTSLH